MDINQIKTKVIDFIKIQAGNKPVILGLSGGIDSAVCAYLAVLALGKDRVATYILPSCTNTNEDREMAKLVADALDLTVEEIDIDKIINSYSLSGLFKDEKSLGNLKARIRMSLLYGVANEKNGLVIGTGNKTELLTGYFTKYGDGGADILPIGELFKFQVRALAVELGVPQAIIDRPPTAGLWQGQTDEAELGLSYNELDTILLAIECKQELDGFDQAKVNLVKKYIERSKHKRVVPLICLLN